MRKFVAGAMVFGFIITLIAPASAQLIDWDKRGQRKGGAAAPAAPAAPRVRATPAPAADLIKIRGTFINLDKRRNQLIIRDASDGIRKAFNVDPASIDELSYRLSRYDDVIITLQRGSNMVISVQVQ